MNDDSVLCFERVRKRYPGAGREALADVSVDIMRGEHVALVGRSGSGKSTFLHLAASIDVPTSGRVSWRRRTVSDLSEHERSVLRRDEIGLIFQFFHLLSHLSVLENVLLPAMIANDARRYRQRAFELLDRVALSDRAGDSPDQLSGGEMQRVAICRSLLRRPPLLLADEPTGNLDDETAEVVMDLLLSVVREESATLLMVTHSQELAARAGRVIEMQSGSLVETTSRGASSA